VYHRFAVQARRLLEDCEYRGGPFDASLAAARRLARIAAVRSTQARRRPGSLLVSRRFVRHKPGGSPVGLLVSRRFVRCKSGGDDSLDGLLVSLGSVVTTRSADPSVDRS